MIVSQLDDPQWTARWIGLEGQGEFEAPILPAFRKHGRTRRMAACRDARRRAVDAPPGHMTRATPSEGAAIATIAWASWLVCACSDRAASRGRAIPDRGVTRRGPDAMTTTGVAIVGASGYAARELIRILLNHPQVRITAATSRQDESPRLDALHPSLARRIDLTCEPFDAGRIAERASLAFLALPHTASMAVVPDLRRHGVRVIDLSADYRLTDAQVYADWYGHAAHRRRGPALGRLRAARAVPRADPAGRT